MVALTVAATPDAALQRAQRGDSDAFAELVTRFESAVFGIACNFSGSREKAEEIAQDVFLQFYRSLATIESEAHALFWLRQVTTRRCIDLLRRQHLRLVAIDDAEELVAASPSLDPLRDRLLRRLVSTLPEAQRAVITLRYGEDLEPSEIARLLDMPLNTIKSHLHRGLATLRRQLGEES